MIQYADFGHYSTPEWCPNVQLYIKYKTQHPSFGQPSETIFLKNLRNSLVFSTLPQNKKILPPQLSRGNSLTHSELPFFILPLRNKNRTLYKKKQKQTHIKKMIRSSGANSLRQSDYQHSK